MKTQSKPLYAFMLTLTAISEEPTRKQVTEIDWRLVSVNGNLVCGTLDRHTRSENQRERQASSGFSHFWCSYKSSHNIHITEHLIMPII